VAVPVTVPSFSLTDAVIVPHAPVVVVVEPPGVVVVEPPGSVVFGPVVVGPCVVDVAGTVVEDGVVVDVGAVVVGTMGGADVVVVLVDGGYDCANVGAAPKNNATVASAARATAVRRKLPVSSQVPKCSRSHEA
jgi:hypothetical protein